MGSEERAARFESLARDVVEPVRRFLARRTDAATAEDVLAETLLVLWRRLDETPEAPLPWAYGVARRCLANAERGARRRERLTARLAEQPPGGPADDGGLGLGAAAVRQALAGLRPQDAELLRLWAWEQLTPAEIAVVLDVTANAVSVRLRRAKAALREGLRKIEAAAGHEQGEGRMP